MAVLALYSNKGGVGKTATTVNLAYLAAQAGYQTLACDLDPQSSTTYYFRVQPRLKRSAQGLTTAGKPIAKSIKGSDYPKLDLLPADFSHRNLDITFADLKRSKERLQKILEPLRDEYELIFLDCPPTINILAENIFNAADFLLVPLPPTTLAVRAYQQLLDFVTKKKYNPSRVYAFFSMVEPGQKSQRQVAISVYRQFQRILKTPIPLRPEVVQMDLYREPVPAFAPSSAAASAYRNLWLELQTNLLASNT